MITDGSWRCDPVLEFPGLFSDFFGIVFVYSGEALLVGGSIGMGWIACLDSEAWGLCLGGPVKRWTPHDCVNIHLLGYIGLTYVYITWI